MVNCADLGLAGCEGVEVLQTVASRVFIVPSLLSERSSLDVPRIMCFGDAVASCRNYCVLPEKVERLIRFSMCPRDAGAQSIMWHWLRLSPSIPRYVLRRFDSKFDFEPPRFRYLMVIELWITRCSCWPEPQGLVELPSVKTG